jgi:hypothetical protein
VERVVAESVGVSYPAINAWQLGTFEVAVPDIDEQQLIADYLDRETAKIDALVEKKEQLIELLQEKRTALITHAVTKGLDPNVPMKDSGLPAPSGARQPGRVARPDPRALGCKTHQACDRQDWQREDTTWRCRIVRRRGSHAHPKPERARGALEPR